METVWLTLACQPRGMTPLKAGADPGQAPWALRRNGNLKPPLCAIPPA